MAKKEKEQPGVMIYFGDYDCVADLPDEKLGRLLRTVIEYAKTGADINVFSEDPVMEVAWKFFRSKVEYDFVRYAKKKESRIYANKVKYIKYHPEFGLDPDNPRDVDRIVQDAKGRFIVLDHSLDSLRTSLAAQLANCSTETETEYERRDAVRRAIQEMDME